MTKALRIRNHLIVIDDCDLDLVLQYRWSINVDNRNTVPAYRARTDIDCRGVYIHNLLFEASTSHIIDHKNGNGLDNRAINVRNATNLQNMRNRRKHKATATSPYKGVYQYEYSGRGWLAKINFGGGQVLLGRFETPLEAACAYDTAAREHFGVFANINFPEVAELVPDPVLLAGDIIDQAPLQTASRLTGVALDRRSRRKPWRAQLWDGDKLVRLGRFRDRFAASRAYWSAYSELRCSRR